MTQTAAPRVLYCGTEDGFFKKLSRHADGYQLDARLFPLNGTPRKVARLKKAVALILKVKDDLEPRQLEWLSHSDGSIPIIVLCQNGTLKTAVRILQYRIFDYFSTTQSPVVIANRIREAVTETEARSFKKPQE